jgi:intracellular multiplication protein IcmO
LFHAKIDTSGPTRLNRPLMLPAPDQDALKQEDTVIAQIAEIIQSGALAYWADRPADNAIARMAAAFVGALAHGRDLRACAQACIQAAGGDGAAPAEKGSEHAEPPVTDMSPMFRAALRRSASTPKQSACLKPSSTLSQSDIDLITAIERRANRTPASARIVAIDILTRQQAVTQA